MQVIVSAPKPNIVSAEEVKLFLQKFGESKLKDGMVLLDRQKNLQALLDLEISVEERATAISDLTYRNYYKGPRPDAVRPGLEFWEFGVQLKGKEMYVKLSLGQPEGPVICYSFHPAERAIKYPYCE